MTQAFFLSAEDVVVMRQVVDWFRKSHGELPQPEPISAFQSPDVYIAKTPDGGIPARDGDTPGNAECDLYRIQDGELSSMGITRKIYNLSLAIIEDEYISVMRTKGGAWILCAGQGIESTGTGTSTDECIDTLLGRVLSTLAQDPDPRYVLGLSDDGCMVKISTGVCP